MAKGRIVQIIGSTFDAEFADGNVPGIYNALVVEGNSIQTVAEFVSSKLSSMENVRQTSTHFLLKKYKEDGKVFKIAPRQKRLNITY